MFTKTIWLVVLAVFLAYAGTVVAKGSTVQLTITGPGIMSPIHSSHTSLVSANVWFGNHFDWETTTLENATVLDSDYHVFFWVKLPRGHIEMMYMLNYRWDAELDRAIVCIPGERDPWYHVNVSSIIRGNEGDCFFTKPEWGSAIKALIPPS